MASRKLVIAIASLGVRLNLLDSGMQAAVILLALVTATLSPVAFRILAPPIAPPDGKSAEG